MSDSSPIHTQTIDPHRPAPIYLDSSALVKLLTPEQETPALRSWLKGRTRLVTSGLAQVEVTRAAHRLSPEHVQLADQILSGVGTLALTPAILRGAASILPGEPLRSLDAIHVASALQLPDLDYLVTYDTRMTHAARQLGLPVLAPN